MLWWAWKLNFLLLKMKSVILLSIIIYLFSECREAQRAASGCGLTTVWVAEHLYSRRGYVHPGYKRMSIHQTQYKSEVIN
jgi:hypothetical protein